MKCQGKLCLKISFPRLKAVYSRILGLLKDFSLHSQAAAPHQQTMEKSHEAGSCPVHIYLTLHHHYILFTRLPLSV